MSKKNNRKHILLAPAPSQFGGPGVFITRLNDQFLKDGFSTNSRFFRYFGFPIRRNYFNLIFGTPRNFRNLLRKSDTPNFLIIGKPESLAECIANGKNYLDSFAKQESEMAYAISESDHVSFISNYVKEIWTELSHSKYPNLESVIKHRSSILFHGLDLEHFKPDGTGDDIFTIGFFGAFRTSVRVNSIFEVSKRLPFNHRVLVVGSFDENCKNLLNVRLLESRSNHSLIDVVTWVDSAMLPFYYNQLDVLVHPIDYEGFGIVPSEAMACGVPIVAPCHGAVAEYVADGGLLVKTVQFVYDSHFYDMLADSVMKIRENIKSYSINAREIAMTRFDIKDTSFNIINKVNQLKGL